MDEHFTHLWFDGFSAGLEKLDGQARATLLSSCAACCADSFPVGLYEKLWAQSYGELQTFFSLLGETEGICTKELEPGKSWQILYPACGCDLVTNGYVATPAMCECSRQSIAYCLRHILPGQGFTVTKETSILQGDSCCCFHVVVN